MPGGVHLSSGNYGSAPNYMLFLTGFSIIALFGVAVTLAYLVTWTAGLFLHLPLAETLLGLAGPEDFPYLPLVQMGIDLLIFLCVLIVMRLSPLSGYHGAEHKVVHCVETYGRVDAALARTCPRAHHRCGTTLLAGLLPIPLIAVPLLSLGLWPEAGAVLVLGWLTRFPVGDAIQNVFTTKEPTDHQLATALAAANTLIARWRVDPDRRVPLWLGLWVRGCPQMKAGVVVAMQLLNWLNQHLPFWLDWGH